MPNYNNLYGNYPYGNLYQPYGVGNTYQQIGYSQPQQPQMQPTPQPQMNQYAFVNGVEGAKSFQLQPNQTIMLMDSDNPYCYMKTSNSIGQSSLRYFKLTEIKESDLKPNGTPNQEPKQEYVLKADFEAFVKKVDDLSKKIEKPFKKENKGE